MTERIKVFTHLNRGPYKMLINSSVQMHDDAAPTLIRSISSDFRVWLDRAVMRHNNWVCDIFTEDQSLFLFLSIPFVN